MNAVSPPPTADGADGGGAVAREAPFSPHAYDDFMEEMERLGLLSDLEEALPPGFSAVFEIARVLESPDSPLAELLDGALSLTASAGPLERAPPTTSDAQIVEVPAGEEYEAEFIRSWSDVRYVYSWQYLLPDEEFLRRLAKRTLWFPMAKAPRIRAIESGESDFAPTGTKQKVYVLMDTSASMLERHRFALAKAIVLRFLRRNRREMGEIFLRRFDLDLGELRSARDHTSYELMIKGVLRQNTPGNGTCLERAILQACADIRDQHGLSGAEILIVTDGAAHLDEGRITAALGRDIRLHCVKIGQAQVYATETYVDDTLDFGTSMSTTRERAIVQLRERRAKIEDSLHQIRDETTRKSLRDALRQCDLQRKQIGRELRETYGHEIEDLADVYVEIPDIDAESVFALDDDALDALKRLVDRLLAELSATPAPPEVLKQAALLLSHLALLRDAQSDAQTAALLEHLRQHVEGHMEDAMERHEAHLRDTGLLSPGDQRDLRVLLQRGSPRGSSLWILVLRYFYATFARLTRRR